MKSYDMWYAGVLMLAVGYAGAALGQHVADPHASIVPVMARQAMLKSSNDPLLLRAIKGLGLPMPVI